VTVSGGSWRGAKIRIFRFDMEAPWLNAGEPGRSFRGEEIAAEAAAGRRSVESPTATKGKVQRNVQVPFTGRRLRRKSILYLPK